MYMYTGIQSVGEADYNAQQLCANRAESSNGHVLSIVHTV